MEDTDQVFKNTRQLKYKNTINECQLHTVIYKTLLTFAAI